MEFQFAAFRCLSKLSGCRVLQKDIMSSRGVFLLFSCLNNNDYELMLCAIHILSDVCSDPSCWKPSRDCGGVQKLINLLSAHQTKLICTTQTSKSELLKLKLTVAEYSAKSLSILYKDEENRRVVSASNIINICQFWIRSKHQNVTIPILILLQHLSYVMPFRKQVNDSGMMLDVLHHLRSSNTELKQAAADLILICADDQSTFKCFYKQEFVTEVFQMLCSYNENEDLMISLSGIIWKCSQIKICVQQFEVLNVMPVFTQLLENQPVQVKAYIVGTIGSCLKNLVLRDMLKKCNGIEIMVSFLQTTFIPLIINLNDALAKGSEDTEILIQAHRCEIIRERNANVQMENSLDGIECIIDLLASKRKELLIPACTLIHNLAKDKNALSVLVEFNVASHLIRLIKTTDKKLLRQLCLAVASCCSFKKGCEKFADCGITPSLLKHLKAKNKPLRITAASALARIASLPNWCSVVSQNRIIPVRISCFL
ncbi:armadillo repeat-containing protein 4 [Trichonephila inaurata madagascariensis]|uniref:Armadillo repeat-containing protein 4 n=1 Tax=Trichonephila inaurata madagascariensis TaxID=2747483 RepID=A0A8X7C641_9ARAC|nr:armadillo repeat-containing protein 4 [Trichonephila inaurata madagascariensis]